MRGVKWDDLLVPFLCRPATWFMYDLGIGVVSSVIIGRVVPCGGVGICSKLPPGKAFMS